VGRYKYVFGAVVLLLLAAVALGLAGSLGLAPSAMHVAESAVFGAVAVVTTAAGFLFSRDFRSTARGDAAPAQQAGSKRSTPQARKSPAPAQHVELVPASSAEQRGGEVNDEVDDDDDGSGQPTLTLTRSFRLSFRMPSVGAGRPAGSSSTLARAVGSFRSKAGLADSDSASNAPAPAPAPSRRLRLEEKVAVQMGRAVSAGILGAVALAGLSAWAFASGLHSPLEWLAFSACFRAVEAGLACAALYTVSTGRNRIAGDVCCWSALDFVLCLWWPCCPCPRRKSAAARRRAVQHAAAAADAPLDAKDAGPANGLFPASPAAEPPGTGAARRPSPPTEHASPLRPALPRKAAGASGLAGAAKRPPSARQSKLPPAGGLGPVPEVREARRPSGAEAALGSSSVLVEMPAAIQAMAAPQPPEHVPTKASVPKARASIVSWSSGRKHR